jgi:hypothetical protein
MVVKSLSADNVLGILPLSLLSERKLWLTEWITDGDVAIGGLEHLVHALAAEWGAQHVKLRIMLNKLSILANRCLPVLRILSRFYTLAPSCFGSPFRKNMCRFCKGKMHIDMEQNNKFLHHYSFMVEKSRNPKILWTMYQNINMHFVNKHTLLSMRITANLRIGLDELKNNCSTVIAV